jgi:hypothetical protein
VTPVVQDITAGILTKQARRFVVVLAHSRHATCVAAHRGDTPERDTRPPKDATICTPSAPSAGLRAIQALHGRTEATKADTIHTCRYMHMDMYRTYMQDDTAAAFRSTKGNLPRLPSYVARLAFCALL